MKILRLLFLNLLLFTISFSMDFNTDTKKLITAEDFETKKEIINELYTNYKTDKRLSNMFSKMLNGALYYKMDTSEFVYLEDPESNNIVVKDLQTNQLLQIDESMIDKITINNKLRNTMKSMLVVINPTSNQKEVRLHSAKDLIANLDEELLPVIQTAYNNEKDDEIKTILFESIMILQAQFSSGEEQLKAIQNLGSCLSPKALEILESLQDNEDIKIKKVVHSALEDARASRSFYSFIETAFFGLSMGSVLLLAAIGLSITFGVMKVINMAHGELMMLGAYTTYTIQQLMPELIEYSVIISIPIAFMVSAIVGVLIERLILRHLYGRPLEALLATFGVSLVLQQIVRTVYSPLNQEVKTPEWMSGALEINGALSLTYNRLYIIVFALLVFFFVLFILKKTSLGLKVRAVSQNRNIAKAMGIKTNWVDAITFGIGSGIAGVAGVALSQLTNVGPNLGQAYIVDSFMVVVFGGVGNLWGTLIASFTLGEINKFIEPIAGAVLAKVISQS